MIPDSRFASAALEDLSGDQLYQMAQIWASSQLVRGRIPRFPFSDGWWTPFLGGVFLPVARLEAGS